FEDFVVHRIENLLFVCFARLFIQHHQGGRVDFHFKRSSRRSGSGNDDAAAETFHADLVVMRKRAEKPRLPNKDPEIALRWDDCVSPRSRLSERKDGQEKQRNYISLLHHHSPIETQFTAETQRTQRSRREEKS